MTKKADLETALALAQTQRRDERERALNRELQTDERLTEALSGHPTAQDENPRPQR